MRKLLIIGASIVAVLGLAATGFAQTGADIITAGEKTVINSGSLALTVLAAAIGIAIAAAGGGIGQGMGLKGACEGVARNPEASSKIQTLLILGLAFIESLVIYALLISLLIFFANPLLA